MKELESASKSTNSKNKFSSSTTHTPSLERLRAMTMDELVKMLMSPEMAQPVNEPIRQQIIKILQEREGNAFVQRLLGKSVEQKET